MIINNNTRINSVFCIPTTVNLLCRALYTFTCRTKTACVCRHVAMCSDNAGVEREKPGTDWKDVKGAWEAR